MPLSLEPPTSRSIQTSPFCLGAGTQGWDRQRRWAGWARAGTQGWDWGWYSGVGSGLVLMGGIRAGTQGWDWGWYSGVGSGLVLRGGVGSAEAGQGGLGRLPSFTPLCIDVCDEWQHSHTHSMNTVLIFVGCATIMYLLSL